MQQSIKANGQTTNQSTKRSFKQANTQLITLSVNSANQQNQSTNNTNHTKMNKTKSLKKHTLNQSTKSAIRSIIQSVIQPANQSNQSNQSTNKLINKGHLVYQVNKSTNQSVHPSPKQSNQWINPICSLNAQHTIQQTNQINQSNQIAQSISI